MTGAAAMGAFSGSSSLDVTVNPIQVSGYGQSGATANVGTAATTASVVGAIGAVTWTWVRKDTGPYTWTIGAAAAATTTFTAQNVEDGVATDAEFEVTATDSVGNTGKATVIATVRNRTPFNPDRNLGGTL